MQGLLTSSVPDDGSNFASTEVNRTDTYVAVQLPPQTTTGSETLLAEVVPAGSPALDGSVEPRFVFGDKAFTVDLKAYPNGFVPRKPVHVLVQYAGSPNPDEDLSVAPSLRLLIDGAW